MVVVVTVGVAAASRLLFGVFCHRKTCGDFSTATFLLGVGEVDIYNILKARPEEASSTRLSSGVKK